MKLTLTFPYENNPITGTLTKEFYREGQPALLFDFISTEQDIEFPDREILTVNLIGYPLLPGCTFIRNDLGDIAQQLEKLNLVKIVQERVHYGNFDSTATEVIVL